MKNFKLFLMAIMAVGLAACSSSNEVTLKVESELGDLGNYISIPDQDVIVSLSEENVEGEDIIRLASSLAVEVNKSVAANGTMDLDVEVLDKNHVVISTLADYDIETKTDFDNGDYHYILMAGNVRAQMNAVDKKSSLSEEKLKEFEERWGKVCKDGEYILLKPSSYTKFKAYTKDSSSEDSESASADEADTEDTESVAEDAEADESSDSEDWDALLNSYEEYVNKYKSLMKKASNGDMDALSEYPALLEKAQEIGDKMEKAKGSMSASQWARYNKITMKLANAAN